MKRLLTLVLVLILSASFLACAGDATTAHTTTTTEGTLYSKQGQVIAIDTESDTVTLVDTQGDAWTFIGAEGWQAGDTITCTMHTQGTTDTYDDAIIDATH